MIIGLVKNPILKARLDNMLKDIVYFDSPIEMLQNLPLYSEVAVIIENSGFEISGFIIVNVIDELVPDRKFNIYLITSDYSKAFLYSQIFKNTVVVSVKDLDSIGDLMEEDESTEVKISYELFFGALYNIILTEKIRTFIVRYSNMLLDNISDPNAWFDEYVEMLYSVMGINKVIISLSYNGKQTVFSSVTNFLTMGKIRNFFQKRPEDRFIILSNTNYLIDEMDKFSSLKITSNGEYLGDMFLLVNDGFYFRHKLENIGEFLLAPVKSFAWFYTFKLQKEENRSARHISCMFPKIFGNLQKSCISQRFEVNASSTSFLEIPHEDYVYVVFSASQSELNAVLGMYIFMLLNKGYNDLSELAKLLNKFINSNILTINPLPMGIAKISIGSVVFCSTEGMLCIVESGGSKICYESHTGYFGTYDNIDVDILEIELPEDSFLRIIPDAFYYNFAERNTLLK